MKSFLDGMLRERQFVLVATLAFILYGLFAFQKLPVEAFPDVTDTQVGVISLYPGHAAEEVEKQITLAIETELNSLPNLSRLRSISIFGLSYVTATFADGTNDYFARNQVSERLASLTLPGNVQPKLAPLATPIGEIYRFTVESDAHDAMERRTWEDWVIERQIKQVPGVADVVSFGGFQKQIQVQVHPARLKQFGFTLGQVFDALTKANANAGGNYILHGEEGYVVRGLGLLRSLDDIRNIVIAARGGTPVLVQHVATVREGAPTRQGSVGMDEDNEVVQGIVLMRKGENPSEVLERLKTKIDLVNKSILPRGMKMRPYYDRTALIRKTLSTVGRNLAEGAVLVVLLLSLFLWNVRAALVCAAIIPLALLSSFVFLRLRGIPANLLSLGSVDFGILVDGAVVMVENIVRHLGEHGRHGPLEPVKRRHVIVEAASEVARPTFFSVVILIVAYLPIFTLERVEGRIFAPMAYTVASALVGALIMSFTLIPVMCFLIGHVEEVESPVVRWARALYEPTLRTVVRLPHLPVALATVALISALALVPRLGSEFLPELNEGSLWVTATLPPSISFEAANRVAPRVRRILKTFPEVTHAASQLGRPEDGTDWKLINNLELFVGLKPREHWRKGMDQEKLVAEMDHALSNELPGVEFHFSQPIKDNVEETISGIKGQIAVKLFASAGASQASQGDEPTGEKNGKNGKHGQSGQNAQKKKHRTVDEVLTQGAEAAVAAIGKVKGVADLSQIQAGLIHQLTISVDREKVARFGINVSDVNDIVETAVGGKSASQLWDGEKRFDIVVRFTEDARSSVEQVRYINVPTPDGSRVPLGELATIKVGLGRAAIHREGNARYIGIKCNIRGRDMGSFVAEAQKRVEEATREILPPGYYFTWGGEFENQQRAMARLRIIVPVSLLCIFFLLYRAFGRARSAALIVLNVPFATIGGLWALFIRSMPLSVSAAIGFIALFGVAVMNGTMLVSYIDRLRQEGAALADAVQQGAMARLRPVLMTASVASLGFVPMALSQDIGSETQRPLATVVIGGLITSTLLTLVVIPATYRWFLGRTEMTSDSH